MRPLIYCPVQFPATKSNPPLAVDLRNCDFLGYYSTCVPFPKQSSANCSWWYNTASSLIKYCCYIFQSLSSVCFHATIKNPVIPMSRFSSTLTLFSLSLIHFKNFWIVLLLMPVIFCILPLEKPSFDKFIIISFCSVVSSLLWLQGDYNQGNNIGVCHSFFRCLIYATTDFTACC